MASATPAAAIESRLAANWTTTDIYLADELNDPPDPPAAFIVLEFPGGAAQQITIGSPGANVYQETGAFMIHVMVPIGTDSASGLPWRKVARNYAETIAEIFRGQQFATSVTCFAPFPPHESERANGNYWGISFSVPFKYEYKA